MIIDPSSLAMNYVFDLRWHSKKANEIAAKYNLGVNHVYIPAFLYSLTRANTNSFSLQTFFYAQEYIDSVIDNIYIHHSIDEMEVGLTADKTIEEARLAFFTEVMVLGNNMRPLADQLRDHTDTPVLAEDITFRKDQMHVRFYRH